MNAVHAYHTDFGTVTLPRDFPWDAIRKNGLPDRRRKISADLMEYMEDLTLGAQKLWEAGKPVHGQRAMTWDAWLKS